MPIPVACGLRPKMYELNPPGEQLVRDAFDISASLFVPQGRLSSPQIKKFSRPVERDEPLKDIQLAERNLHALEPGIVGSLVAIVCICPLAFEVVI